MNIQNVGKKVKNQESFTQMRKETEKVKTLRTGLANEGIILSLEEYRHDSVTTLCNCICLFKSHTPWAMGWTLLCLW